MSKQDNSKVVNLHSKHPQFRDGNNQHAELLQACRKSMMNFTAKALAEMFDHVDDALFDAADKAESNKIQSLFFDGMRELRIQRPQVERDFHQKLSARFQHFIDSFTPKSIDAEDGQQITFEELSVLHDEAYEESMILLNIATRAAGQCAEVLYGMNQRLSILVGGQKVTDETNPIAPKQLIEVLSEALQPIQVDRRIKEALYQLFDIYVIAKLPATYQAINNHFIEANILPNLKYTGTTSEHKSKSKPQQSNAQQLNESDMTALSEAAKIAAAIAANNTTKEQLDEPLNEAPSQPSEHAKLANTAVDALTTNNPYAAHAPEQWDEVSQQLFDSINGLIDLQRKYNLVGVDNEPCNFKSILHSSDLTDEPNAETFSQDELLSALGTLQKSSLQEDQLNFEKAQPVDQIQQNFVNELNQSNQSHTIAQADADIIDLVGMLFDFILDDENLPDVCKTALSHLHTPYLKIALLDKELFVKHQHPARRLLNSMAQAAVLWPPTKNDERGVLAKIQHIVRRVVKDFSGDISLFDELVAEFKTFTETVKKQNDIIEKRAVEAAKGRDKLVAARNRANLVISKKLSTNNKIPSAVIEFIKTQWHDVLVFILLRHGTDSPAWRKALQIVDEIFWSVLPKYTGEEKQLLKERQPHLMHDIKQTLIALGSYQANDITAAIKPIVLCQRTAIKAQPPKDMKPETVTTSQPQIKQQTTPVEAEPAGIEVEHDTENLPNTLEGIDESLIEQLKALEFGTWFKFNVKQKPTHMKLSWFSPTTWNYMFVDKSGNRVIVKSIEVLARELTNGDAEISYVEKIPLMDRALDTIHSVLKRLSKKQAASVS
ncbi:DUF1631 domain-containing protein [Endozoicomonas sp. SM1973]|uniref:DUF1631 domain-containing protein n=1 Tax=Spartinivicinus marinus TaxID=2994442 RepID=A0A853I7W4_9GAMM|nr:DUF1631 domain-containing protein [Spartinivicinus marinus]MCX4028237.1 DUF1631 domain-containing protein [Spartinivicinus marinus]NYZ69403.1 DUF1631 domain-containing protein [Spartinivicinus marinus]